MLVKTVPSKWAAPTSFIKIPARLVAGKENIATLIHGGFQACLQPISGVSLNSSGRNRYVSLPPSPGVSLKVCVLTGETLARDRYSVQVQLKFNSSTGADPAERKPLESPHHPKNTGKEHGFRKMGL